MIRAVHLQASAAALAAALLFGCRFISEEPPRSPAPAPSIATPPPPRVTLDSTPGIGTAAVAVAGWVEWVSADGRNIVIELAAPPDPPTGRVWWVRDEELRPVGIVAIQLPRHGLRLGAVVTHGRVQVGAEVVATDPRLAPKIPPLQSGASK